MTAVADTHERSRGRRGSGIGVVDCDVHNGLASPADLKPYLPERWHAYYDQVPGRSQGGMTSGARPMAGIFRHDSRPPGGGQPGSDLELMRTQLLDRWNIRKAILSPLETISWPQYGEAAHAFASAMNDWLVAEWLDRDDRLCGSIVVPAEDGPRAASEIHRVASDSRFVHILLPAGAKDPYGHTKYWPIYEAAAERGLPLNIHVGGFSGSQSGAGWFSYFFERHVGWSTTYPPHVVSLVASGVFDRYPTLQFVLQEGHIAWMPSLMWRLDRSWKAMQAQVPHLTEPPSEVIRRHFWFTTQPIDEPTQPHEYLELLDHLDMSDRIMYASDYPHWDFDPPDRTIPPTIKGELREKIFHGNAESLYAFPS